MSKINVLRLFSAGKLVQGGPVLPVPWDEPGSHRNREGEQSAGVAHTGCR